MPKKIPLHTVKETATPYLETPTFQTTITSKGQVVIPAALRRKFGLTPQVRLTVYEEGDRIVLRPITEATIEQVRGKYKGTGALRALLAERAADREREDAKLRRAR